MTNIHLPTTTLSHQDVASNMIEVIKVERIEKKKSLSDKKTAKNKKIKKLRNEIKNREDECKRKKKKLEDELKAAKKELEGRCLCFYYSNSRFLILIL